MAQSKPSVVNYDIFVRVTLGRFLPQCLLEVVQLRPADPIEFIAQWLYKAFDSQLYYQAKAAYLRELGACEVAVRKERRERTARLKPFVEAMRTEKWNFYKNLTEEMEALSDFIANVDVPVDEVAKRRYQKVQKLVHEEETRMQMLGTNTEGATAPTATELKLAPAVEEKIKPGGRSSRSTSARVRSTFLRKKASGRVEKQSSLLSQHGVPQGAVRMRRPSRDRSPADSTRPVSSVTTGRSELSLGKSSKGSVGSSKSKESDLQSASSLSRQSKPPVQGDQPARAVRQASARPAARERSSETSLCESTVKSHELVSDLPDEAQKKRYHKCIPIRGSAERQERAPRRVKPRKPRGKEDEMFASESEDLTGRSTKEDSYESSSRVSSATAKLPSISPRDSQIKRAQLLKEVTEQLEERESASKKMKYRVVKREAARSTLFSDDSDTESDEENVHQEAVQPPRQKYTEKHKCEQERLHLPPLKSQTRMPQPKPPGDAKKPGDQPGSGITVISDPTVRLPAIPTSSQATGTIVMTHGGHIAYVSRDLGVVASNALRIRNVHPMDKPEMWEQRRFLCQSFYDHELYSQSDVLDQDVEEDYASRNIPRMTMEEFLGPPGRRWSKHREGRPH